MKYPKINIVDADATDTITVHLDRLVDIPARKISDRAVYLSNSDGTSVVEYLNEGQPLSGHSFFLNPEYDWIVVKNSAQILLVPLKKKE